MYKTKRYFVDLYSLLFFNPIEFYERDTLFPLHSCCSPGGSFVLRTYSSSNRDFYFAVRLVTVAANDQDKKLYRVLSPSTTFPPPLFNLSFQRAQKLRTSLITLPSGKIFPLFIASLTRD